jgi:hypothetical protein
MSLASSGGYSSATQEHEHPPAPTPRGSRSSGRNDGVDDDGFWGVDTQYAWEQEAEYVGEETELRGRCV